MGVAIGVLLPFVGTCVGAAAVFFLKNRISSNLQRIFTGFAAGVMVAASVWSLIIPAIDMCADMGKLSFIPALVGVLTGVFSLLFMNSFIPCVHMGSNKAEGTKEYLGRNAMLILAVTIHNLPEGAACGAVFAGVLSGEGSVTMVGAVTLAIGIAIQNIPEGAIVSLPLRSEGKSVVKSFGIGVLSGVVEPMGAILAILLANIVNPILPYMLAYAAGAMLFVVVEELVPESGSGEGSKLGTIAFAFGFALMMVLDVALG